VPILDYDVTVDYSKKTLPFWLQNRKKEQDPRGSFLAVISEYGLRPTSPIVPGEKFNRCPDQDGKRNDDAGWWTYHEFILDDGMTFAHGSYGSWRNSNDWRNWTSFDESKLDDDQRKRLYAERQADRERNITTKEEKHTEAAKKALEIWNAADGDPENHPYCLKKGIRPSRDKARYDKKTGKLVVPMYFGGEICCVQEIDTGFKKFLEGGRCVGAYLILGPEGLDTPLYVAEGFATSETVKDATGCETWCAFSSNNMAATASAARAKYPMRKIIMAGDNDHEGKHNTGVETARLAAQLIGGEAICPPDAPGKTDWNDHGVEVARKLLKVKKESKKEQEKARAKSETAISGMIADTLNWMNIRAKKQQPEISLLNILVAVGAVTSRKYKLETYGTVTNLYGIGICDSAGGKNASRSDIKKIFYESGLDEFLGSDEIRSTAGILEHLHKSPSMIYNVDEIGMFFSMTSNKNAASHIQGVSQLLTSLYSASDNDYRCGKLKGTEDAVVIKRPSLSVYGTTTEEKYAEAMKRSTITSGELNRYIIIPAAIMNPLPNDTMDIEAPESVLTAWSRFRNTGDDSLTIVRLGDMAAKVKEIRLHEHSKQTEFKPKRLDALYGRYSENILKVAMILAISRNSVSPVIEEDILDFAESFVTDSVNYVLKFCQDSMFENEHEKRCNALIQFLNKNGKTSTRTAFSQYIGGKCLSKDIDAIESSLCDETGSGRLLITKDGRRKIYTLIGD
jgi:putative DNA primase/helicase